MFVFGNLYRTARLIESIVNSFVKSEVENIKNEIQYGDCESLKHLWASDFVPTSKLILESDVVCGFSSSALLEAAIAAKPVIVPLFDEALRPEYQESIAYFYYYDLQQLL